MPSRPELRAPPEFFYIEEEARKYTTSSCIIEIQGKLTERALELLALPDDGVPRLLLYIGCGSGLSGDTLSEKEHHWIGLDISKSMLDVALEREVDGGLLLADMGSCAKISLWTSIWYLLGIVGLILLLSISLGTPMKPLTNGSLTAAAQMLEGMEDEELSRELSASLQISLLGGNSGQGSRNLSLTTDGVGRKVVLESYIDGLHVSSDENLFGAWEFC